MSNDIKQESNQDPISIVQTLSKLTDQASEYLAQRKGLLPLLGILMVFVNFLLVSLLPAEWYIVRTNFMLHLGLITAIFGILLAWAL